MKIVELIEISREAGGNLSAGEFHGLTMADIESELTKNKFKNWDLKVMPIDSKSQNVLIYSLDPYDQYRVLLLIKY